MKDKKNRPPRGNKSSWIFSTSNESNLAVIYNFVGTKKPEKKRKEIKILLFEILGGIDLQFTFRTLFWAMMVFKLGTTFEVKQSGTGTV